MLAIYASLFLTCCRRRERCQDLFQLLSGSVMRLAAMQCDLAHVLLFRREGASGMSRALGKHDRFQLVHGIFEPVVHETIVVFWVILNLFPRFMQASFDHFV